MTQVDIDELRDKVKVMYRVVAEAPHGAFHFEMGQVLAHHFRCPACGEPVGAEHTIGVS
jgi:hypothetical protein